MCSNIPNMVQTFGYINASWTLRADLTAEWVCRVLNHMEEFGYDQATPRIPDLLAKTMEKRFWIHDFSAGYMQRMMPKLPRQGTQMPWVNPQNFGRTKRCFGTAQWPMAHSSLLSEMPRQSRSSKPAD
jgi:hypothetical protein